MERKKRYPIYSFIPFIIIPGWNFTVFVGLFVIRVRLELLFVLLNAGTMKSFIFLKHTQPTFYLDKNGNPPSVFSIVVLLFNLFLILENIFFSNM